MDPSLLPSPGSDYYTANIGYEVTAVSATFLGIVVILVILRVIAQSLARRSISYDDYFLWAGVMILTALDGICIGP